MTTKIYYFTLPFNHCLLRYCAEYSRSLTSSMNPTRSSANFVRRKHCYDNLILADVEVKATAEQDACHRRTNAQQSSISVDENGVQSTMIITEISDDHKHKEKDAPAAIHTLIEPYSSSLPYSFCDKVVEVSRQEPISVIYRNRPNKLLKIYQIKVEEGFDLEKAVCNHGFFMMAPNRWLPSYKSLRRPLRLADGCSSVIVSISSPPPSTLLNHSFLLIHVEKNAGKSPTSLSESDEQAIQKQAKRMLKLTNKDGDDVRKFQEMHAEAKIRGFGRLFRSPDLFEDVIKTILLSNTTWKRTLEMCRNLCELQAELQTGMHNDDCVSHAKNQLITLHDYYRNYKKKNDTTITPGSRTPKATQGSSSKSRVNSKLPGNFPTSKELAGLNEKFLQDRCQLGYRAKYIIQLANLVEEGKFKLGEFEKIQVFDRTIYKQVQKKLMKFKGIGSFGAANIVMCMGDYQNIPTDSETIKHIRQVHGITKDEDVQQVYDIYEPYQCLAYWYEQVESYENKLGKKLSKLPPSSYHMVAVGSYLSSNKVIEECGTRKRMKTRLQV